MPTENQQQQSELVRSLASTIRKKIVAPAAGRVELIDLEIKEIDRRIEVLEKELSLLAAAHSRTRMLAAAAVLGVAVLGAVLIIPLLK